MGYRHIKGLSNPVGISDPRDVGGCDHWFSADYGVLNASGLPAANNELVDTWQNRGTNGTLLQQTTDAQRPTFIASSANLNSKPGIQFASTKTSFSNGISYTEISQPFTVVQCAYFSGAAAVQGRRVFSLRSGTIYQTHPAGVGWTIHASTQQAIGVSVTAAIQVHIIKYHEAASYMYINRSRYNVSASVSTAAANALTLGSDFGNNQSGALLAEFCFFRRELSQQDIDNLLDYFQKKYNITYF